MYKKNTSIPPASRVALVTGASSGLGAAIAKQLIEDGWFVFGVSRQERSHGNIRWLRADLCDTNSIGALAQNLMLQTDRLDAVIHNAGAALSGPTETPPPGRHPAADADQLYGVRTAHPDVNTYDAAAVQRAYLVHKFDWRPHRAAFSGILQRE